MLGRNLIFFGKRRRHKLLVEACTTNSSRSHLRSKGCHHWTSKIMNERSEPNVFNIEEHGDTMLGPANSRDAQCTTRASTLQGTPATIVRGKGDTKQGDDMVCQCMQPTSGILAGCSLGNRFVCMVYNSLERVNGTLPAQLLRSSGHTPVRG